MAIHWTPLLAVGIERLDAQHRAIFDTANRLLETLGIASASGEIASLVRDLCDLAEAHFAYEEALMDRLAYPHANEHRAAHTALRCEAAGLRAEHDAAALTPWLAAQTKHFVCDWLLRHIPADDQELGSWCARQGRAAAG